MTMLNIKQLVATLLRRDENGSLVQITDDIQNQAVAALQSQAERITSYETLLSAVMPPDFKDWHQNSQAEWPAVAAWVITNLRERLNELEQAYDAKCAELEIAQNATVQHVKGTPELSEPNVPEGDWFERDCYIREYAQAYGAACAAHAREMALSDAKAMGKTLTYQPTDPIDFTAYQEGYMDAITEFYAAIEALKGSDDHTEY